MAKNPDKIKNLKSLVVTTSLCAAFFGISDRQIRNWKASGCPVIGYGAWPLYDVFKWWQENIMENKSEEKNERLDKAKLEYWEGRGRVQIAKANAIEEKYLPIDEIDDAWVSQALIYKAGLLALSHRLPAVLEGKNQLEMKKAINKEAISILTVLSRDKKYCSDKTLPKDYLNIENFLEDNDRE